MEEIFWIILKWAIPALCAGILAYVTKKLKDNDKSNKAIKLAMLSLIRAQTLDKCEKHIEQGYLLPDARYCLEELFKQYQALRWKSWSSNVSRTVLSITK